MLNRRDFALAALAATAAGTPALAQSFPLAPTRSLAPGPRTPDASELRAGDFLWPKPPGSWVPYGPMGLDYAATPAGRLRLADEEHWARQREDYLARPATTPSQQAAVRALRDMTYPQFADSYFMAQGLPGAPGGFYVGHVAIVEIHPEDGPMIIEATPPDVRRIPYAAWREEHRADLVFHGRMKTLDEGAGEAIAARARAQVRKPYNLFNLNLLNDRSFYCSKLAWCAVWRATGRSIDGNNSPHRWPLFTPKQMFYCDTIEHLNSSGARGTYLPAGGA